ncbi:hypothetical protein [Terasakiella pusilla]|uniref:hypothetical protein n=1 Tax=Terasakiella pusilla TaxID=64973 RepID=UPI0012EBB7F7|nr:hypothetical protein [Terasakiella pusilla]
MDYNEFYKEYISTDLNLFNLEIHNQNMYKCFLMEQREPFQNAINARNDTFNKVCELEKAIAPELLKTKQLFSSLLLKRHPSAGDGESFYNDILSGFRTVNADGARLAIEYINARFFEEIFNMNMALPIWKRSLHIAKLAELAYTFKKALLICNKNSIDK